MFFVTGRLSPLFFAPLLQNPAPSNFVIAFMAMTSSAKRRSFGGVHAHHGPSSYRFSDQKDDLHSPRSFVFSGRISAGLFQDKYVGTRIDYIGGLRQISRTSLAQQY